MCGIAGILNLKHTETRLTRPVRAMTDRMKSRGPDGEGYALVGADGHVRTFYGDDTAVKPAHEIAPPGYPGADIKSAGDIPSVLALGHRRLSIIDLSHHGHQPMCTACERYWIVFNGEIYNYRELAKDLQNEGVELHGHSDTEVLLNAYASWGPDCLKRFNGMFALAIWDNTEQQLFCARDRIGIKPFYYSICGDYFIFASDIKTIIASGIYDPAPDPEGLYLAMAYGIAPRPKTAFKDLESLPQAHWMRINGCGQTQTHRYWSIPVCSQEHSMTESDAVGLLEDQLHASIERRLVADVPVGTFMSGGIDSTTISAMASKIHPGIKAFTLAFEDTAPELDEVPQAKATALMCDMQHIIHSVEASVALRSLDKWIQGYEEPYYGLASNYVISEAVAENGVKVILNGLGGDELFAGYSWYQNIDHWHTSRILGYLLRLLSPMLLGKLKILAKSSTIRSADRFHSLMFRHYPDAEIRELFKLGRQFDCDSIEYVHDLYADNIEFEDDIEALSYMDLMNYVGNHHVHRVDQFTMMHSIEGRFPFLDHELVEAAFRIPSIYKRNGEVQKYALQQVAKKYIAPECLAMTKKGFSMPLRQWMDGPLRDITKTRLTALASRDTINADAVWRWNSQYLKGYRGATKIWHLVALEMWYEQFIDAARMIDAA